MIKLNFKSYIIGFLTAILLLSIIPVSAAVQNVTAKLGNINCKIDGQTTSLNSLNYNNKNYVQLRDVITKMKGSIAVSDNTIVINSNQNEPVGDVGVNSISTLNTQNVQTTTDSINQKPISTPDGITQIDKWEGKYYIGFLYIQNKIKEKGYILSENLQGIWSITKNDKIILDNIPTVITYGYGSVEYDYYVNIILPLII